MRDLITFPHVFRLVTRLVEAVEAEIGHPVEAWPTQILHLIHAVDPHISFAMSQLEKVIAFFFAHNVPVNMAYQFFAACSFFTHPAAQNAFKYFYKIRAQYAFLGKDIMYYNLEEQKFKCLDGSYVEALNDLAPTLGYEGTGFPSVARNILTHANQRECVDIEDE